MWIRTQSGESLVKVYSLHVLEEKIVGQNRFDKAIYLGVYEDNQRALQVLSGVVESRDNIIELPMK